MFLLVNNRPIQSADSIGFWPIVSVSADSQNSTIGRPLLGAQNGEDAMATLISLFKEYLTFTVKFQDF